MADFPSLSPTRISYDLGGLNVTDESTATAGPVRFRHSLRVNNNIMTLTYTNLTQTEISLIRNHYNKAGGLHYYFLVPDAVIWGSSSGTVVPTTSKYRYNAIPEEEQRGIYHDCSVQLSILTANDLLYIMQGENAFFGMGGAGNPEEAFTSFVLDGTAPFILDGDDATPTAIQLNLKGGGAYL